LRKPYWGLVGRWSPSIPNRIVLPGAVASLRASPVKMGAGAGIPVRQPTGLRDPAVQAELAAWRPIC
jgi:hypothetical protein